MKKDAADKWVAALRSGEHGRLFKVGSLLDSSGFAVSGYGWRLAETSDNLINGEDLR